MALVWTLVVAAVFTLLGLAAAASAALGLPGVWMVLGLAVLVDLVDGAWLPAGAESTFSAGVLIACLALALVGEALEFLSSALGARTGGSGRHGALGALAGAPLGGIAGIFLPVPFFGPLIGAVAGAFIGALVGEAAFGRRGLRPSLRPATGATVGRVLGTAVKVPVALLVWAILAAAAFVP